MACSTRLRKLGLIECYHSARHYLGLDSCVVSAAQYTTQDGLWLTKTILFPALRSLIDTHAALGLRLDGNETTDDIYLVRLPSVDLSRIVEFSGKDNLQHALESQLLRGFETQADLPLYRVEVLADNTVLFAFHHTIADGMSGLAFHLSLFKALQQQSGVDASPLVQVPSALALLPPVDNKTELKPSLSTIGRMAYNAYAPAAWTKAHSAWTGPTSPLTPPDLTTSVRLLAFCGNEVAALCAVARKHEATLTSAVYVLALTVLSGMVGRDSGKRYTRIGAGVAVSLREIAGVPNDVLCDYPTIVYDYPRVLHEFSWPAASRFAAVLQTQKRKGRETIGMLEHLDGKVGDYLKLHIGEKRETGFTVSNVGRVKVPAVEGKWAIHRTMFAQCDVVTGAAFMINITGDPTGALNVTFTWGAAYVEAEFVEEFIAKFQTGIQKLADQDV
ncbi:alcohol acetyltransferase [Mycena alexandri]|uniref:Alcohol acetyltransferase n=1 Tax=Mycena alexandri TaxID=1745969 RepID=A0AAD6X7L6_9AGAR|nr:alcohol acetyltransferase [Mycena alexandri]